MSDLILSANEISDFLKYDKKHLMDELIANARKTILAGQKVIIRETFGNAPSQDVKTFTTTEEIDSWEEDINLLDDINAIKKR